MTTQREATENLAKVRDHNQLKLALMKLAVNARYPMPHDGEVFIFARKERVTADHATRPPAGDFIKLLVVDEGTGMDEPTLLRATEPFFTTKGVGKGAGLDLSMVHGLAEQSGGRLIVKSERGKGTQMELWLPVASARASNAMDAEPLSDETIVFVTPSLQVLAIDDDPLVLATICAQLENLVHQVTASNAGLDALDHLRTGQQFDVVISDHAMPVMNGAEFARHARTLRPDLPIIVATGCAELDNISEPAPLDLPRLKKPFSQRAIRRAIEATVGKLPV